MSNNLAPPLSARIVVTSVFYFLWNRGDVMMKVVSYNAAAYACVVSDRSSNDGYSETDTRVGSKNYSARDDADAGEPGWWLVLGLMSEMRENGLTPDEVTFSTAVTACGRAGEWERALSLLDEMATERECLTPDVVAINAAIDACGRAGQCQQALDLLGRMMRGSSSLVREITSTGAVRTGTRGETSSAGVAVQGTDGRRSNGSPTAPSDGVVATVGVQRREGSAGTRVDQTDASRDRYHHPTRGGNGTEEEKGPLWPPPDTVSFNAAMEACARAGRWRVGAALLPRMRQEGARPDVRSYASALACLRAGGEWACSLELLEDLSSSKERRGFSPDLGCYGTVMATLGEAGEWERALELLRRLQQRRTSGISSESRGPIRLGALSTVAGGGGVASASATAGPNIVCYNAALAACAKAGAWHPALTLLEEMEERGIFDVVSFNSAMHACRGQQHWRKAVGLLNRMRGRDTARGGGFGAEETVLSGGGGPSGVWQSEGTGGRRDQRGNARKNTARRIVPAPDAYSFTSAIAACGAAGEADVALDLLRGMQVSGVAPNVAAFNAAIYAVGRAVVKRSPIVTGEANEGDTCNSSVYHDCEHFSDDLDHYGGCGDGGNTWASDAPGTTAETTSAFAAATAPSDGVHTWQSARGLIAKMREVGLAPNVKSYNTVLAACQRAAAWRGALNLLDEMKRGTPSATVPTPTTRARAGAAHGHGNGFAQRGRSDFVPPPDLISFNTAIGVCGRAGRWEEALSILDEIPAYGRSPDVVTYNTAAAACARVEKWETALEVLDRGRRAGVIFPAATDLDHATDDGNDGDSDDERAIGAHTNNNIYAEDRRLAARPVDVAFYDSVAAMARRKRSSRGEGRGGVSTTLTGGAGASIRR